MYSKNNTATKKGVVSLGSDKGTLRLQLPRTILTEGMTRYIPLGLKDTEDNRVIAESYLRSVQLDIITGKFDYTLEKYKQYKQEIRQQLTGAVPLTVVRDTPKKATGYTIGNLWDDWCEYKKPTLKATTYLRLYLGGYLNKLKGVSDIPLDVDSGVKIRNHLLTISKSARIIKDVLQQLESACNHAIQTDKIKLSKNPFYGLTDNLKIQNTEVTYGTEIADKSERIAFTKEEMEIILEAFKNHKSNRTKALYPYIFFKFHSGCRNGEGLELRWGDINFDKNVIVIQRSYDARTKVTGTTKTSTIRIIKMSDTLRTFLLNHKPDNAGKDDLVFTTFNGKRITQALIGFKWHQQIFNKNDKEYTYLGVVLELYQQGKIGVYLPSKNTRHTFRTLAIAAGVDSKVLVGLRQKSSPNEPQTGFISGKYVTVNS